MNSYNQLLTDAIKLSEFRREGIDTRLVSKLEYIKMYCTVRLDVGRSVGKTKYILRNSRESDLVIFNYQNGYDEMRDAVILHSKPTFILHHKGTGSTTFLKNIAGACNFHRVWIDEYSKFKENPRWFENLSTLIASLNNIPTIIALG